MRLLFFMGHPAQFHLFKNIIFKLKERHQVSLIITNKDILQQLCYSADIHYDALITRQVSNNCFFQIWNLFIRYIKVFHITVRLKPELLIGSEVTFPLIGKIRGVKTITFGEDDYYIIKKFARVAYPFTDTIISPVSCDAGRWEKKKIGYFGYQKLAYLHPNQFFPDINKVNSLIKGNYFILRFAQLNAYHDNNKTGITRDIAQNLIDILKPYGNIFITSERELEPEFERYRLNINPLDMHSVLAYATIYIGDSQSMAVESAVLGVPSIRFNDFAEDIGVLNELEKKYNLTFGINTTEPQKLYKKVRELLRVSDLKHVFSVRRERMLSEKIDVLQFFIWFIENYPESAKIMKENPDYQNRFK